MPQAVLRRIKSIQRKILWGEVDDHKKIPWNCWVKMYSPKSHGGLGIKDISIFNDALIAKCR